MAQLFTNGGFSTLASGISAAATSLTLQTGDGAKFPFTAGSDYFVATLTQAGSTETSWELVRCTRSGDTLTIARGQEGTTPQAWSAGDKIELRVSASYLNLVAGSNAVAAADPWWGNVVSLLQFASLTDAKGHTLTNNLCTIDTSTFKFGPSALALPGGGSYLDIGGGSTDFAFGTGDFTIELWVRHTFAGNYMYYDSRPSGTDGNYPTLYIDSSWNIQWIVNGTARINVASGMSASTWYHVAVCRLGSTTTVYVNGVVKGSWNADTTNYINGASRPVLGMNGNSVTQNFQGNMDDVRVTRGIARYTAAFTAPTAAFPTSSAAVTPAGSDTHIQFNDGGSLGGDTDFTWDKTNNVLTLGGAARVKGDFSNATIANRVMFQSSTTNGLSSVSAAPNGTGGGSYFAALGSSNVTNAPLVYIGCDNSLSYLSSAKYGTGTYLPLVLSTNGAEKMRIGADATGTYTFGGTAPRIVGDFSNATFGNRAMLQTSTTNGNTNVGILPNGTSNVSALILHNNSTPLNSNSLSFYTTATTATVAADWQGTNTGLPLTFNTGGSERLRIDTSGNLFFDSGYGSAARAYGCRAWVNFNGTGTVAIRASGNVTSITDNAGGDYTINFTNAMPDANYGVSGFTNNNAATNRGANYVAFHKKNDTTGTAPATDSLRITTGIHASDSAPAALEDCQDICVSIFR